jgi:hypothetical protein
MSETTAANSSEATAAANPEIAPEVVLKTPAAVVEAPLAELPEEQELPEALDAPEEVSADVVPEATAEPGSEAETVDARELPVAEVVVAVEPAIAVAPVAVVAEPAEDAAVEEPEVESLADAPATLGRRRAADSRDGSEQGRRVRICRHWLQERGDCAADGISGQRRSSAGG